MLAEAEPTSPSEKAILLGACLFLIGTGGAAVLYAKDPYSLTMALFTLPPVTSWPFHMATGGSVLLILGGLTRWVRRG